MATGASKVQNSGALAPAPAADSGTGYFRMPLGCSTCYRTPSTLRYALDKSKEGLIGEPQNNNAAS